MSAADLAMRRIVGLDYEPHKMECESVADTFHKSALAGSAATGKEVIAEDATRDPADYVPAFEGPIEGFGTPAHYLLRDGSQSMDLIEATLTPEQFEGFLRGNALKYMIRYDRKGQAASDLSKATDYAQRLLKHHEKHNV